MKRKRTFTKIDEKEFLRIKDLLGTIRKTKSGKGRKGELRRVQKITGRASSTLSYILRSDTYEAYREFTSRHFGSLRESNHVAKKDPVQEAIENLDSSIETLKDRVGDVIVAAVENNNKQLMQELKELREYKKKTEVELASYKTVVETAKKSNLVDTLTKALRGGGAN